MPWMHTAQSVERIAALFAREAQRDYFGEPVSLAGHMLQAAALAEQAGAADALVAAALLHDLGHLRGLGARWTANTDDRHEEVAARWLAAAGFPTEVREPIRLHVTAKRYLCQVDPSYWRHLSPASQQSLGLQGGPLSLAAARMFESSPHAQAAIALRRWDDAAKDPHALPPLFDHFRPLLEQLSGRR